MAEIWFYHLSQTGVEEALPPLLEKCLQRGWRAQVRSPLRDRLQAVNAGLWTYRDEAFLPHGLDGPHAARQPVLLTQNAGALNGAKVAFLLDGAALEPIGSLERVCPMFDGRNDDAVAQARSLWREVKRRGLTARYWKQGADGRWVQDA